MIDLEAIRQRNEKRKRNYGESQQYADGDLWTVGAETDIDDLIGEVVRLRLYGSEPDNPYEYGVDTLTPEESDRIKARFGTEEEG